MSLPLPRPARYLGLLAGSLVLLACAGLPDFDLPLQPPGEAPVGETEGPEEAEPESSPRFFYTPGLSGVADATYSRWEAGERLFVGVDGTNLRAEPTVDSEVVTKLTLGTEVEVLGQASEPEEVVARRNVWYRIRARTGEEGHLFGALLSPLRVTMPSAGGEDLVAVVTFSPDFGPRVRAWAPPEGTVYAVDARPPELFAGGGVLEAKPVPQGIEVELCDPASNRCNVAVLAVSGGEFVQLSPPLPEEPAPAPDGSDE